METFKQIMSSPATAYMLSFGGLGVLVSLALNTLHKLFDFTDRQWGLAMLCAGAVGGVLIQRVGLVTAPTDSTSMNLLVAAFVGAGVSAAAAGFSAVDLRAVFKKTE